MKPSCSMFRPRSIQLKFPILIMSPVPLAETAAVKTNKRKVWKISKKAPRVDELFNTFDESLNVEQLENQRLSYWFNFLVYLYIFLKSDSVLLIQVQLPLSFHHCLFSVKSFSLTLSLFLVAMSLE